MIVAAVTVAALGLGAWAMIGDLPFVSNPFRLARVPAYLEPGDPVVEAARQGAVGPVDVVARARDGLRAVFPARSELWGSGERYGFSPQDIDLWIERHQVVFRSYPPFTVPDDPSWSEDPNDNISWEADYQSLTWLLAPERAYQKTNDPRYLEDIRHYLLDWIADATVARPPSVRTWYDDAVSLRTNVIVSLLSGDLWDVLNASDLATVLASIQHHGELLRAYLDDPQFKGHNHNLFHALSLYNLATALPSLRDAPGWREAARDRISSLLPELVDPDEGASLEGAPWYHAVALQTYATAAAYLQRQGSPLSADEIATVQRMVDFNALILQPSGTLPALGDTPVGATSLPLLEQLAGTAWADPTVDFVLSHGERGSRPPDAAFFPNAGYAILRPAYSRGNAWTDDLQVIVDTSNSAHTHGHADALSVLLAASGVSFLGDSGGPYIYGGADHRAFTGAAAHNTVVDLGRTGGRGAVRDLVMADEPTYSVVSGSVDISAGAALRRVIILLKPDLLVVVDLLKAIDGQPHQYSLAYHLPPDATVSATEAGRIAVGPAQLAYVVVGGRALTPGVVRSQEEPLLGWVTTDFAVKVPAPVLTLSQPGDAASGDAWFVSAFEANRDAGIPTVNVTSATDEPGTLVIRVEGASVRALLEIDADGDLRTEIGAP